MASTRSWGVWEDWVMLEEAREGSIYSRASRGVWAPPRDTWTRCPTTNGVSERGRTRHSSRGNCWRTGMRTRREEGDNHSAHCTIALAGQRPCPLRQAPASASSRRVNGAKTKMVARFGTLRQAGKRARDQQRLGRVVERVGRMPARLDERGHRVNSDIMPT